MKVPITRRDDEIARSILRRVGSEDHGALTRLLQGLNPPDGRPPIAEVHWRYRHAGFEEGGTFWPTLPDTFDEFVEMLRAHSCSVFYEETLPACGIAVDPEAFPLEEHRICAFAIDLPMWSLGPLDAEHYDARRRHPAYLERWFAGLPEATPSPATLAALTCSVCETHGLPFPGPLVLSQTPIDPRPEGKAGSYAVRQAIQVEAAGRRARSAPRRRAPP